ncbi:MAG: CdaR family protein [Melioribacter sp.]|uniref:CdaR family protein n=1 Tax=Rosettibacter primus TaxID=3111523 RepID=UPI00247B97A2|nr:CdaR family protein [Melioribacter sp.]
MKNKIIPITFIIIFSLILWGSVTLSEYYVEIITVPVELIDLPQNYSPNYISDPEITLKVKAKGWELAKLILTGEHSFYVSAHHRIGKFRVDLRNEIENNLWLTSAFNVLEISPPIFEYEIDKTVTKKVSIKPNIKINFAENYDLVSDFVLTPSEVEISGPASILQNINYIETDSVVFNNVNEKIVHEINLKSINGVNFSINKCKIEFDVQKIVERAFDDLFVEIRNVPPSKELNLYPGKVSVILRGGINRLGKLTNDSIKVYVDYWEAIRSEENMIEPVIEIPEFTKLLDVKPKKLEFVIKQY